MDATTWLARSSDARIAEPAPNHPSLWKRLFREKKEVARSLRMRAAALDGVGCNVMLTDVDGTIVYTNEALRRTFETLASAVRGELPWFDPDRLIGRRLDLLQQDLARATGPTSEATEAHSAELRMGGRVFRVLASPLFDHRGRRTGTMVQWIDRTQELAIEREIGLIVSSSARGDLSRRIGTDGGQGFPARLAAGVNALLDNTSDLVKQMERVVLTARQHAEQNGAAVMGLINTVRDIEASSKRIVEIISGFDDTVFSGGPILSERGEEGGAYQ